VGGRATVEGKRRLRGGDMNVAMAREMTEESSEVEGRTPLTKKLKSVVEEKDLIRMDDEDMQLTDPPPYTEVDVGFEPPDHRDIEGQDEESGDSYEVEDGDEEDDDDEGESPAYETPAVPREIKPKQRVLAKKSSVLKIYTDGSSRGNGSASAIAGVGVWFGDHDPR
jgi:ribonuclease HI